MKISYRRADVITAPEPGLVHGCNAQGVMNSGVARQVREAFPEAWIAYRDAYTKRGNKLPMGLPIFAASSTGKVIINLVTQEFYGRDAGRQYVDYVAVRQGFKRINAVIPQIAAGLVRQIAMPLIGAGLGGGHWPTIAGIIEDEATNFAPYVYVPDGVIPT